MWSLALLLLLVSGCEPLSIRQRTTKNEECGHVEGNMLRSPRYPHNYPTNAKCVYTIPLENHKALKLKFLHFDIESSVNCSYDFLEVKDSEVSYGRYCGHTLQGNEMEIDETPYVKIVFHSDESLSKTGFQIKLQYVNEGQGYGGHKVEAVTVANTEALPVKPTSPSHSTTQKPFEQPQVNKVELETTAMPEATSMYNKIGTNHTLASTTEVREKSQGTTYEPSTTPQTNQISVKTISTESKMENNLPTTSEATAGVFPTNEPELTSSKTNKMTAPTTSDTQVGEVVTTKKIESPVTTPSNPTEGNTEKVTPTEASKTSNSVPETFTEKRKMNLKMEVSNDDEDTEPSAPTTTTTAMMNSSASSVNESFPTEFPMGNESVALSNFTGNESVPTEGSETPGSTDELMSTMAPTMEPETTIYKPEPEKHVLDKLKLMALIQRIKFTTLQMEQLLIGKIVEEEVQESRNGNQAKREMDDFRYGIDSYLGFGRRTKRNVKRDVGKEFIDKIKRIDLDRKRKKRSKQARKSKSGYAAVERV